MDCNIPLVLRNGNWSSCESSPKAPIILWIMLFIDAVKQCTMCYLRLIDPENRNIFHANVSQIVTVCMCMCCVCISVCVCVDVWMWCVCVCICVSVWVGASLSANIMACLQIFF